MAGMARQVVGHGPTYDQMSDIESVRSRLDEAGRILILTGAGVSAESGIPTFRSPGGWWRERNPLELATPEAFASNPETVWEWYDYRRRLIAEAEPNPAHRAIARLQRDKPDVLLVTQNVDDLHERAGSVSPVHIHGRIWWVRCAVEGTVTEYRDVTVHPLPPRCSCGALLRPDVVWFGEALPHETVGQVERWMRAGPIDVTLVIGTEAVFGYIQDWALRGPRDRTLVVEVNVRPTALTPMASVSLPGKAGEILPRLLPDQQ